MTYVAISLAISNQNSRPVDLSRCFYIAEVPCGAPPGRARSTGCISRLFGNAPSVHQGAFPGCGPTKPTSNRLSIGSSPGPPGLGSRMVMTHAGRHDQYVIVGPGPRPRFRRPLTGRQAAVRWSHRGRGLGSGRLYQAKEKYLPPERVWHTYMAPNPHRRAACAHAHQRTPRSSVCVPTAPSLPHTYIPSTILVQAISKRKVPSLLTQEYIIYSS